MMWVAILAGLAALLVSPVYLLAVAMIWIEDHRKRLSIGLVTIFVASAGWIPVGGFLPGPGRAEAPSLDPVVISIVYPALREASLGSGQRAVLSAEVRDAAYALGSRGGVIEMRRVEPDGEVQISQFRIESEPGSPMPTSPGFLAQLKSKILSRFRARSASGTQTAPAILASYGLAGAVR